MPHIFCFGYGTCAQALRQSARHLDWQFSGTGKTEDSVAEIRKDDVEGHLFTGADPIEDLAGALDGVSHLLISIPPGEEGDVVLHLHGRDLSKAAPDLEWIGYLSTTGVYGDQSGAEVDEAMPLEPVTGRGRRRVAAEEAWRSFASETGVTLVRFRLPGLYGPARNPLRRILGGDHRRINKLGHVFSRIHTDDVALAIVAAIEAPSKGGCFNLCDDEPAAQSDVIAYGCELLNMNVPPLIDFDKANLSPMARSFYEESRWVKNDLVKQTFGLELRYPTYREGLRALLKDL